ncbi:MAG: gliding motility-associated C-terminal domain-containing protein [Flavobacteriales bacterium]
MSMSAAPQRLLLALCAGLGIALGCTAQPCATGFLLTTSPLPQNGTYSCGQSVTFCLTVTGWNSTNANWFHGVSASFGPGWDLGTLTPGTPPATCGGSGGTWGWYNTVQGTAGTNIGPQGPGFFFDLNNDGNPGNNFGDFCVGATDWEFCWTISVLSPPACVNGLDLGVSFNTFGDSETGSWGSGACGNDPIVPSPPAVVEACAANAGTGGAVSYCGDGTPVDLFTLLGGTPDAGGSWTGPGGIPHGASFDPASDTPGTYTYTVGTINPPCSAQTTVQITVVAPPSAGADAVLDLCTSSPQTALLGLLNGADPGGVWTGPTGAPFNGVFDPATNAAGVHSYVVNGTAPCASASAEVIVNVTPAAAAGDDASVTLCNTSAPIDLFDLLGGTPDASGGWTDPAGAASTGIIDPSNAASGTYTYTIPAVAPCPADMAVVDVTLIQQPSAGENNNVTFCRTAGNQPLLPLLGGTPTPGGSWTSPSGAAFGASINTAVGAAGTYIYTVSPAAPCATEQSELTITLIDQPDAGPDGTLLLCAVGAPTPLAEGLAATADGGGSWSAPDGSATNDLFDPASGTPGIYTYTLTAPAPCVTSSAAVEVTVVAQPDAGTDGTVTLCSDATAQPLLPILGPDAQAGGTWTAPGGVVFNGTLDPGNDASGEYTYLITAPAPCSSSSAVVTVTLVDAPDAGTDAALTACAAGDAIDLFAALGGSPDLGGTWTTTSGVGVASPLDAASATSGGYIYTVAGDPPCAAASSTVSLTVVDVPDSGSDAVFSACNDGTTTWPLIDLLGGAPQSGGSWTAPDGSAHGPTLDPAIDEAGTYTYTITGPAPCPSSSSNVEVVIAQPVPTGSMADVALCSNDGPQSLIELLDAALPAGGVWTHSGGVVAGTVFDPANMPDGTYTYTLQATAPCPGGIHQLGITTVPAPDAGDDAVITACSSGALVDLFDALGNAADAGGNWIAPNGAATTGLQDPASAASGTYTYVMAPAGPCVGDTSTVELAVTLAPSSGTGGSIALCRSDGAQDPLAWLSGLPDPNGVWTDPNGTTITVADAASMLAGTYTYTVAGDAPCPNVSTTVQVTVQELPEAGDDLVLNTCLGNATIDLSALTPPGADAGGSWSTADGSPVDALLTEAIGVSTIVHVVQGIGPCANEVDSALLQLTVNPLPVVAFTVADARGCAPLEVQFAATVDASVTGFDWDFGNGGSSDLGPATTYTYVQDGLFPVSLTVTDTNGCAASSFLANAVVVSTGAEAVFFTWPARVSVEDPSFTVEHVPVNGVSYQWAFGADSLTASGSFRWTVEDAVIGAYPICLVATDSLGCAAVSCANVFIDDALTVFVPNAFTPDGDDLNETFLPSILGLDPDSYQLIIADRWGREVFSSTDHTEAWTGAARNSGELLPQGVYVWRLLVRDNFGAEGKEYIGTVTLLK